MICVRLRVQVVVTCYLCIEGIQPYPKSGYTPKLPFMRLIVRKQNRAERFVDILAAVLARFPDMRQIQGGTYELVCGPFLLHCTLPGYYGSDRGLNINVWPGRIVDGSGMILHDNKVANVDWFPDNSVDILSYRSGPWEQELLSYLRDEGNVVAFRPVNRT